MVKKTSFVNVRRSLLLWMGCSCLELEVVIEKAVAEGLPAGWIKEIKVTKTGHKVRRDPYYIDPVSGYRFRSMRDAVRYLETGEIGRLAYKPKDKDSHDEDELEDDKDNSPTAAKKQKVAVPEIDTDITGQSTKVSEAVKNEDALDYTTASKGECISPSERTSSQGGARIESRDSNLSEAKDFEKMDGGKASDKNVPLSTPEVGVLLDRQSSEMRDETCKATPGKCKSRKKKALDLPRRASKRLAGLALDPTPELKTTNRTRQAVVKQSEETTASADEVSFSDSQGHQALQQPGQLEAKPEAISAGKTSKSTEVLTELSKSKHPSVDPKGHTEKIEMEYKSDLKQGCADVLQLKNQDRIETDCKADEKSGPVTDLPFGDLLSDPCIAFAIKTLTGVTFETSIDKEVSLESNNSKSEGLAALEEHAGEQMKNESDKKQENPATPEKCASNLESSYKTEEKLGNTLDLPFADIWRDPCIEFAIKTLTGTIPVGYDLDMQDYIQQQLDSSQTQASNNFCQTEVLCQQYDTLEKPLSREKARAGNLNTQNPGGASFHQQSKKRCNECR
ncbi:Methyl-CpG-binding domain-containing 13-like protein [Melia azedarach]|uniref:Methyl-CpG-binding domain-containing 13-like protein n=1 Tax=Melia azedarach TaxID=155640 RepID=A0ACC1X427_MELAZ|nr:Methyl-CpG-binding domain-containing 13-like protein [Melia azedarach]